MSTNRALESLNSTNETTTPPSPPDEKEAARDRLIQLQQRLHEVQALQQAISAELQITQQALTEKKSEPQDKTWSADTDVRRNAILTARKKRKVNEIRTSFQQTERNQTLPQLLSKIPLFKKRAEEKMIAPVPHSAPRLLTPSLTVKYNQAVILDKINKFALRINAEAVSQEGHCHGMGLVWSYMMANRVENVFYNMIKQIAECPDDKLLAIHHTLIGYFKLIEAAQNSHKYFDAANDYKKIHVVVGESGNTLIEGYFDEKAMTEKLNALVMPNALMLISGWGYATDPETGLSERKGHTVNMVMRDGLYHFWEANYESLGHKSSISMAAITQEVFERLFTATKLYYFGDPELLIQRTFAPPLDEDFLQKYSFFNQAPEMKTESLPEPLIIDIPDTSSAEFAFIAMPSPVANSFNAPSPPPDLFNLLKTDTQIQPQTPMLDPETFDWHIPVEPLSPLILFRDPEPEDEDEYQSPTQDNDTTMSDSSAFQRKHG